RRLDEADRVDRELELAVRRVPRVNGNGLPLRVQVPAEIAVDEFGKLLFALDREAGAAAAVAIVPLNAHKFRFGGLAGEISRGGVALQIRVRQVALGKLLARIAHPAG